VASQCRRGGGRGPAGNDPAQPALYVRQQEENADRAGVKFFDHHRPVGQGHVRKPSKRFTNESLWPRQFLECRTDRGFERIRMRARNRARRTGSHW